jgi:uncharacterized protein YunC (DUF1805 family)
VDRRQERQSSSILVDEIRERKGIFEKGIVGSPFDSVCKRFCLTMKSVFPPGTKIPAEALLSALREAGWIDCGRLQSREAPSKKHVFAAPELVKTLSKSDLRRLLDDKDLADIKTQSLISSSTKALSAYEFIMEQINNKADIFANGIVGSPFHSICSYLSNTNPSKIQISVGLLITALKDAGWVDCGRIKSREIDTKKHIFATIELVKNYSKSDLRRMVDSLPAYQSIERSITFNAELNETLLLAEIRNRRGIFSVGIIGSPFDLICKQLTHLTPNGIKMPKTALLNALKEAGWVDCGRLNSREATSKKHIFAVPELATSLSKSDLRRAIDS